MRKCTKADNKVKGNRNKSVKYKRDMEKRFNIYIIHIIGILE